MNTTTLTNTFHTRGTDIWTRAHDLCIMLDYERPKLSKLTMDTLNGVIDTGHHGIFQKITIAVIIGCFNPDGVEPGTELCLYFPDSPIFRSLCLEQVDLSLKHLSHVSSLPLLQELELKRIYVDMGDLLFPLLRLVPNLVRLSLDSCDIYLVPVPAERPKSHIPLSKLEKLTLRKTRLLHSLDMLFKTPDMPNIRTLKFGVGPTAWVFPPRAIDWGIVFQHHTLEKPELEGFSSEIMEDLVTHVDKLDKLKKFGVLPDDPCERRVDFPFDLALKLSGWPSHCPMLQEAQLPWNEQLDPDSWEMLKNLKTERPSLHIYLEMEELECSEEENVMAGCDSEEEQDSEEESLVEEEGEGEEEEGGDAEEEDDTGSDCS
ncbi:hypothetical protein FRC08_004424 [Ceratobasidium sp. 394]|nr:hypothetical protein FRC08_004424 [Ceratobasidium sp. 394]KAG9080952.1 hypothetical protein FS749_007847 [Ceratobasidium sp. UAMH 11750]